MPNDRQEEQYIDKTEKEQEIILERREQAKKHAKAIEDGQRIELKTDLEKGSKIYWDNLASILEFLQTKQEVSVLFGELSTDARKIAHDLHENGRVSRDLVDSFFASCASIASDKQKNLAEESPSIVDQQNSDEQDKIA